MSSKTLHVSSSYLNDSSSFVIHHFLNSCRVRKDLVHQEDLDNTYVTPRQSECFLKVRITPWIIEANTFVRTFRHTHVTWNIKTQCVALAQNFLKCQRLFSNATSVLLNYQTDLDVTLENRLHENVTNTFYSLLPDSI